MKANFVRVVGQAVAFEAATVLLLHPEQARRRAAHVAAEKGGKNAYRLAARQIFKAGEVVGIVGDATVEKAAALHVEEVSKAEFDAYGERLADRRAASHTKSAAPSLTMLAAAVSQLEPPATEPQSGTAPTAGAGTQAQQDGEGGESAAPTPGSEAAKA
ncbi:hypothetical protein ATO13_08531 [Stappia sp. 22II-S9-Z10]|nr:hypothetical protein ATO13_08531 [Stappia sp. 22II-S9-Z10]